MRSSTIKILAVGFVLAAVALFPADGLRALGLGEARVDSYLGQPLNVSIRLVQPESDAVDSLTVASASPQDYDRLGIPSNALSLDLDVSIDRSVEPPQVRVRSRREVADPVVQVLIDARWSSGRVLREYTLFLDPPTLPVAPPVRRVEAAEEVDAPAQVTPAPDVAPAPETAREPAAREPSPTAPRAIEPARDEPATSADPTPPRAETRAPEPAAAPAPRRTDRSVGPIAPGQTLWSIASAWRPSTGLTMSQVMLAILDRNPEAFIDGNVNQLRRDAMLEMPSTDAIASIDPAEAERRMQAQMMGWQPMVDEPDVPVISDEAVPEVMDESDPAPVADADDGSYRLEVVPPEGEAIDDVPAVSETEIGEASRRLTELEDQFFIEGLEDDELFREVEEIRDAIEARDMAGLAVANEGLANLEARLREAREAQARADELAAQEEAMAEAAADEMVGEASIDGAGDDVDDYFRDLEDELGASDEDVSARAEDELAATDQPALDVQDEDQPARDDMGSDETLIDTPQASEQETARPQTVVVSDRDGGFPAWLLGLIGAAIALVVGVGLFLRKKLAKGPADSPRAEPTLGVDELRERVDQDPDNLDAHLALLHGLADRDDESQFADALDAMYARVGDDSDSRWQAALNLAVMNAPDHPLLTPPEVAGAGADESMDGLDDRTREMLGILETPDDEADERPSGDDPAFDILGDVDDNDDQLDSLFDAHDEADTPSPAPAPAADAEETGEFDMAALSDSQDDDWTGDDEVSLDADEALLADSDAEDPALEVSDDDELDLDFEFSSDEAPQKEGDALSLDDLDAGQDDDGAEVSDDEQQDPAFGPADTLDLSGESASNDTVRLDPDELDALSLEDDGDEAGSQSDTQADGGGTVRADDTLDLVSNSDLDFEDVGDRELEAFLSEGDDSPVDEDDDELIDEGEAASILDDDEGDEDDEAPELSNDDADVKLDLAQAYLSMGDSDSARTLLEEIISGGSKAKRARAQELLDGL
jgi:pilus assembly protein FimV